MLIHVPRNHFKILGLLPIFLAACQPAAPIPVVTSTPSSTHAISGTITAGASLNATAIPALNAASNATSNATLNPASGESDVIPGRLILELKSGLRPQSLKPLQAATRGQMRSLEPVRSLAQGATLYALPGATSDETMQAAQALTARSDVLYAEPDRRIHALQTTVPPNDPLFPSAWWLNNNPGSLNAVNAWKISTGLNSTGLGDTVIAVIDTGILANHPDLKDKILPGYDFISDPDVAIDGDGRDANPEDPGDINNSFHGSHVAGLAAASSNNTIGMTGVSWGSRLLPVRVLGFDGGSVSDLIDALAWSAGLPVPGVPNNPHPATVINLSLGETGACSSATQAVIHSAIRAGSSVVVAAGNEKLDAWTSNPGNCDGVLNVGAAEPGGAFASYSNHGARLDVITAGGSLRQGLTSTIKTSSGEYGYGLETGTSMAAPLVSATIALIKSVNPNLTVAQIRKIITSSVQPLASCRLPDVGTCTSGLLDAATALQVAQAMPTEAQADFDLQVSRAIVGNTSSSTSISVPFQTMATNGFAQTITWGFEANSSGITGTFINPSSTPVNPLTTNTVTLNTGAAKPGDYTVRIKGSSLNGINRSFRLLVRVIGTQIAPIQFTGVQIRAFHLLGETNVDVNKSKQIPIGNPVTGAFNIADLEDGTYRISAWKDVNANRIIDPGDWYGEYRQLGLSVRVKPPIANANITLEKVAPGSNPSSWPLPWPLGP
jgi:serine protease